MSGRNYLTSAEIYLNLTQREFRTLEKWKKTTRQTRDAKWKIMHENGQLRSSARKQYTCENVQTNERKSQ